MTLVIEVDAIDARGLQAAAAREPGGDEWPPEPARLFAALAVAHYAVPDPALEERAALEWLEALGAPLLSAAPRLHPPGARERAVFGWLTVRPPPTLEAALRCLAQRVVRLTPSSLLVSVRVRVSTGDEPFTLIPDDRGEVWLRVPRPGQLLQLQASSALHRAVDLRVLPASVQRYRRCAAPLTTEVRGGVFGADWEVLRCDMATSQRWPLTSALGIAHALRRVLFSYCEEPIPEILSGHTAAGSPSQRPHLAIVPLPHVGAPDADGSLLGVALVLPRACSAADRRALRQALLRWVRARQAADGHLEDVGGALPALPLYLGASGTLPLHLLEQEADLRALRASTWAAAARRFVTVTPIALDRNPGELWRGTAAQQEAATTQATEILSTACARVGLPAPASIALQRGPLLQGGAPVHQYPAYPPMGKGPQRVLVHAALRFADPVRGPLLIGAGRYLGLGLLRPVEEHA